MVREERLQRARARIVAIDAGAVLSHGVLAFGDARIDRQLPGGGLALGRWHEAAGEGLEIETGAAAAAFFALVASPLARRGAVVWVMRRRDLYAPGLAGLGFPAERLIQVKTRDEAGTLAALEDALGSAGVAAALGETDAIDLVAGRRLQLACEKRGATGFVIRRRPFGGRAGAREGKLGRGQPVESGLRSQRCDLGPVGLEPTRSGRAALAGGARAVPGRLQRGLDDGEEPWRASFACGRRAGRPPTSNGAILPSGRVSGAPRRAPSPSSLRSGGSGV